MAGMGDAQVNCRQIFESQHGIISRKQALNAGFPLHAIDTRVERRDWIVVYPGVYRLAGAPDTWHQRLKALLLWAGPETVLSHRCAGALWGLAGIEEGALEAWSP